MIKMSAVKLMPLLTPQQPWAYTAIDFTIDLLYSDGKAVIMVMIDRFSKSLHLVPLNSNSTDSPTVDDWFRWNDQV